MSIFERWKMPARGQVAAGSNPAATSRLSDFNGLEPQVAEVAGVAGFAASSKSMGEIILRRTDMQQERAPPCAGTDAGKAATSATSATWTDKSLKLLGREVAVGLLPTATSAATANDRRPVTGWLDATYLDLPDPRAAPIGKCRRCRWTTPLSASGLCGPCLTAAEVKRRQLLE
jgi:hypothetical protein